MEGLVERTGSIALWEAVELLALRRKQLQLQAQQCTTVHHNGDWKSLLTRSPGFDDSVLAKTVGGQ